MKETRPPIIRVRFAPDIHERLRAMIDGTSIVSFSHAVRILVERALVPKRRKEK